MKARTIELPIIPQQQNANRHTPRGMQMLQDVIEQDGWIGAVTTAADGETIDGSARVEVTEHIGKLDDAIVLEIDGTKPVVLVRKDIPNASDERAKRLALAANRVPQVNLNFDPDVLRELEAEATELGIPRMWTDDEWRQATALDSANVPIIPDVKPQEAPTLRSQVFVEIYCTDDDLDVFRSTLDAWAKRAGVTINIT